MRKSLPVLLILSLLSGCVSRGTDTFEFSRFVLTQSVYVQSTHWQVFFQGGGPIRALDIDKYQPFCRIDTALPANHQSLIEVKTDTFEINRVYHQSPQGKAFTVSGARKVGARFNTIMEISSTKQPFVQRLFCQRWVIGSEDRYLNMNEIERILGSTGKFIE